MFIGFSEEDGEALYDSQESGIQRAKMMRMWANDPNIKIMVQRRWVPTWLARRFRYTFLEKIGYYEEKE